MARLQIVSDTSPGSAGFVIATVETFDASTGQSHLFANAAVPRLGLLKPYVRNEARSRPAETGTSERCFDDVLCATATSLTSEGDSRCPPPNDPC